MTLDILARRAPTHDLKSLIPSEIPIKRSIKLKSDYEP